MILFVSALRTARSFCYGLARVLGWINAIHTGHVARHYGRVTAYRMAGRIIRKAIR